MSYRQDIVDAITPLLPAEWRVEPYSDEPDVLDRPLVMVTSTSMEPGAIRATYGVEFHVYVLTPNLDDPLRDADAIDDAVLLLLHALLRMRAVTQGRSERVTFQGGHPCWDITITVQASITDDD